MANIDLDYYPSVFDEEPWLYPEPTDEEIDADMERSAQTYGRFMRHRDTTHQAHVLEFEAKFEREFVGPPSIDIPF